ncbi:hypothetical protein BG011_009311, partial [Mortierella polycephala]
MAKGRSEKTSQRQTKEVAPEEESIVPVSTKGITAETESHHSKDTTSERRNKSWTRSLKKATNSILYMAMPPTSADHAPMVVAQTPMSPDRLVPALHSPILQSSILTTASHASHASIASISTIATTTKDTPAASRKASSAASMTKTATSSILSAASSSSMASSSPSKPLITKDTSAGHAGPSNSPHQKQRSSSSTASSSSSSTRTKQSLKGKERAEPLPSGTTGVQSDMESYSGSMECQVTARSMSLTSPPSSPPNHTQDRGTKPIPTSALGVVNGKNLESLPSPPPSPLKVSEQSKRGNTSRSSDMRNPAPTNTTKSTNHVGRATGAVEPAEGLLPRIPPNLSRLSIELVSTDPVAEARTDSTETSTVMMRQDIVVAAIDECVQQILHQEPVNQPLTHQTTEILDAAPAPLPAEISEVVTKGSTIEIAAQPTPSDRKPRTRSMVVDASGFPTIPRRPLTIARSLSKRKARLQPVKNAPWVWHQDGIHHQRLESHQILTKDQVFEQFHLDLEQEGPNGFFLFKLVKRFKRQDPSLMAISNSLLGAEITTSPSSSSPPSSSSILDSIDAASVSQKLKRQLLLQKRKKQRKSSNDNEEEDNLEALLTMTSQNTSLQNLNSSLQEVIDAVDSLKKSQEWTTFEDQPQQPSHPHSQPQPKRQYFPDSDGEYTSRDKDAMDADALEAGRGVYATGRLDGMNLISKKKFKALQRRSSTSGTARKAGSVPAPSPATNGHEIAAQERPGYERRGSEATDTSSTSQSFKKQAVAQLHIYSRNGLKFKFDVMQDNELHFVEASKKYTFMDPLAAHRQPVLDKSGNDALTPLRSSTISYATSTRRSSSGTLTSVSDAGSVLRRNSSTRDKSSLSSTGSTSGSRRVFVTRLGRHTLLTYAEYRVLAKSASSFTLGAKLLFQRSIPSFYGSSSFIAAGYDKESSPANGHDTDSPISPTKSSSGPYSTPTPSNVGTPDNSDYFSLKKKTRKSVFASKTMAAMKSPSTPQTPPTPSTPSTPSTPQTPSTPSMSSGISTSKTQRPIVTPYNPSEYRNKSLTVSTHSSAVATDIPQSNSSSSSFSPSDPATPSAMSTSPPSAGPNTSSSSTSNPYNAMPLKRQGNQAGLKFQHLFVTIHQRLQRLELENGAPLYSSALVQWTVIECPAELRWWRDKVGIQMIGRLEGDEALSSTTGTSAWSRKLATHPCGFSSAMSMRSSYMSAISDATSSFSLPLSGVGPHRTQVSVERLGYRFLRVSGHMGTLKVTVSEQ